MNKIIDRIQKLLRLAGNAGSEAEAALAAERAAALMDEHEIHEAQLSLDGHAEIRTPEPIEKCFEVTKTQKRVAWHMRVTNAVAKSYGSACYWSGGRVVLFGRLSTVQAASYTAQYLMREVERLTDREAPSTRGYSRAYRNAFRLGCANRLAVRLAEQAEAKRRAPAPVSTDGIPFEADTDADAPPAANTMALAIVEKDRKEVEDAYADFSKKWTGGISIGKVSNGSGYAAGRSAGDRVNLGGNARGSLKAGQGTLR